MDGLLYSYYSQIATHQEQNTTMFMHKKKKIHLHPWPNRFLDFNTRCWMRNNHEAYFLNRVKENIFYMWTTCRQYAVEEDLVCLWKDSKTHLSNIECWCTQLLKLDHFLIGGALRTKTFKISQWRMHFEVARDVEGKQLQISISSFHKGERNEQNIASTCWKQKGRVHL